LALQNTTPAKGDWMNQPNVTRDDAKQIFLLNFSDEELWKIWIWISQWRGQDRIDPHWELKESIRDFFRNRLGSETLLGLLKRLLHASDRVSYGGYVKTVLEFPRLKEILSKVTLPKDCIFITTSAGSIEVIRRMPAGLIVGNDDLQGVLVTEHAWARFCVRYLGAVCASKKPIHFSQKYFIDALRQCFKRAREAEINKTGHVKRLIAHKFEVARYFYDPSTDLRFVVRDKAPYLLRTVEKAVIK